MNKLMKGGLYLMATGALICVMVCVYACYYRDELILSAILGFSLTLCGIGLIGIGASKEEEEDDD